MNERKLNQLFQAARGEVAPGAPENFDTRVLNALTRETRAEPISFWEQLEALFPRAATCAALVVAICLIGDFAYSAAYPMGLSGDVNEVSEQWLFPANVN